MISLYRYAFAGLYFLLLAVSAAAQNVGVGTASPHSSAMLDVQSTTRGMLIPRMTSAQRSAIANPAKGLLVFDNDASALYYYSGSLWTLVGGGGGTSDLWKRNGSTNYVYITGDSVGIGTSVPTEKLHVSNGSIRLSRTANSNNYVDFNLSQLSSTIGEWQGLRFFVNNTKKAHIQYYTPGIGTEGLRLSGDGVNNSLILVGDKVGVGKSDPAHLLDVGGSAVADYMQSRGNITAAGNLLVVGTSVFNENVTMNDNLIINDLAGTITFKNNEGDRGYVQLSGDNLRVGTFSGNANGRFIVRVGGGDRMWVDGDGNVGIGTTTDAPGYKLRVGGKVIAESVRVRLQASWPDYVFSDNYALPSIYEVENFIQQNKHLPNVKPASVMQQEGQDLGEVQTKLMEKVEELTLYIISLQKQIDELKKTNKK